MFPASLWQQLVLPAPVLSQDYSMPKLFQDEDPPDEDLAAGVPSMAPSDPLSMTMPWVGAHGEWAETARKMDRVKLDTWNLWNKWKLSMVVWCFACFCETLILLTNFRISHVKARGPIVCAKGYGKQTHVSYSAQATTWETLAMLKLKGHGGSPASFCSPKLDMYKGLAAAESVVAPIPEWRTQKVPLCVHVCVLSCTWKNALKD